MSTPESSNEEEGIFTLMANHPQLRTGGSKALQSERIHWLNYHGRYNTGLPDHWLLVTDQETSWGAPYFGEVPCLKCGKSAVLSQHGDTRSQRFEYKINCFSCGLVRPLPGKAPTSR